MTSLPNFQQDVRDFHLALQVPAPESPTPILPERHRLRSDLIREEIAEFREALAAGDYLEQIDALCDILYVTFGAGVEMGVDLASFWPEVRASNLAKITGHLAPISENPPQLYAVLVNPSTEMQRPTYHQDIEAFHQAKGIPAPKVPTPMDPKRHQFRGELLQAELDRFEGYLSADDFLGQIEALCGLIAASFGAAVEMGIDLDLFWPEVQATNMAKLGGPIRADGKRMKPPGWTPPQLGPILAKLPGEFAAQHATSPPPPAPRAL